MYVNTTFRFYHPKKPAFVDSILSIIKANPGCCDEVWLASDYGFPKIESHKKSAALLSAVAEKFRNADIRVSLQLSNTIGHGEYMKAKDCTGLVYEGSPVEHMCGPDGTVASYCFCWRGKYFTDYVLEEVTAYVAAIKPYCVWIDDDLRANNHDPVDYGCFCDNCIREFNRQYCQNFTRDALVKEINYGDIIWRERFVAFVREGLADFTYKVAKAIHTASPHTYMGYQYAANGGYTGYGYDFIFDAMKRGTGKPPKSRPGGGCYDAHNPNDLIRKKFILDYANSMLPNYVTEIRPEIENLPDAIYGKSISTTCLETGLYFASGANAMSYAMIMNDNERMSWHNSMFKAFADHREYWETLAEISSRTNAGGLQVYFSKEMWKRSLDQELFSYNYEPWEDTKGLARIGVPISFDNVKDPVYLLHENNARLLSAQDIEYLLTQNVVADGGSIEALIAEGYGNSLGIHVEPQNKPRLYMRLLKHPANGDFYSERGAGGSFLKKKRYVIFPDGGTIDPFCVYDAARTDPEGNDGAYPYGIAATIVHTKHGGRWAVFGRNIWDEISSLDHRNQILHAADYISGNKVPVILENGLQSLVMPRENSDGKVVSVSILNCEIGASEELTIRIRRPAGTHFTFMSGKQKKLELDYTQDNEDYILHLPSLNGWTIGTIFTDTTRYNIHV